MDSNLSFRDHSAASSFVLEIGLSSHTFTYIHTLISSLEVWVTAGLPSVLLSVADRPGGVRHDVLGGSVSGGLPEELRYVLLRAPRPLPQRHIPAAQHGHDRVRPHEALHCLNMYIFSSLI